MRPILAAILLSGCSLYFPSNGPHGHGGDDDYVPDASYVIDDASLPDANIELPPGTTPALARCENGTLRGVTDPTGPDQPGHGAGSLLGTCAHGCQSASIECTAGCENAMELCQLPASAGASCELVGTSCTAGSTIACPQETACGLSVPSSTCTCQGGVYACTEVTPIAETQQAIVGQWSGTVTPPSFAQPYQVSLWIYPDGSYWAECAGGDCQHAFYYGGDGPLPDRRITIVSDAADTGAYARIAIDFGGYFYGTAPNVGGIAGLTVDATHLRFTFYAAWFGCDQPFLFDLTRSSSSAP
jgi:hypothetical protein